jgi:type IV pilus assembly protein PilN
MSTRINLLPWRETRRKEQDRQILSIGVGAWILMGLIIFYAHLHVTGLIENQQKRNEFLNQEIKKVDEQIKEIRELQAEKAALLKRMHVIQQLQLDRTQIVHLFDDLVRKMPEGVYLTSLKQTGKNIVLTGDAQSNARVSALMRNLDASDWFANPDLDVINVKPRGSDRISEFTLRVAQKAKLEEPQTEESTAKPQKGGSKP